MKVGFIGLGIMGKPMCRNLMKAGYEGDLEGALEAQFTLAPFRIACGMGTFPAAIKEGLVQEGIPVGKCLDPIGELTPEEKEKLHKVLADMNLV